jgi:hypothetical protein
LMRLDLPGMPALGLTSRRGTRPKRRPEGEIIYLPLAKTRKQGRAGERRAWADNANRRRENCGPISRGHVYKILSNPIYVGRIAHKGQTHDGQHPPIVGQNLWEQVQQCLRAHQGAERAKRTRRASEAPLAGKLFDDRGNRMSPSWAKKGAKRWRYYVSQAALQGDKSKVPSNPRAIAAVPLIGGFCITTNPARSKYSTIRCAAIAAMYSSAWCTRFLPR